MSDPDESTSYFDVRHWLKTLLREIARLNDVAAKWYGVSPLEPPGNRSFLELEDIQDEYQAQIHWVVLSADHLVRSLTSPDLPAELRGLGLSKQVQEAVQLLRNLYEHWDEQRDTFQGPGSEQTRSAAKYAELYGFANPWAAAVSSDRGVEIGQTLRVDDLRLDLEPIEAAVDAAGRRLGYLPS